MREIASLKERNLELYAQIEHLEESKGVLTTTYNDGATIEKSPQNDLSEML